MKTPFRLLAAVAALALPGCQSAIDSITYAPPEVAKTGDYGPRPSKADCQRVVLEFIKATFKDPRSVQDLEIGEPTKYSRFRGIQNNGGYFFAWLVTFRCNAKNSYGGYVGIEAFQIVVRDGEFIGVPNEPVWHYFRRVPPGTPGGNR